MFCVKALQRVLQQAKTIVAETFPFEIQALIGNPTAHTLNKRFVDADLNRQFTYSALQQASSSQQKTTTTTTSSSSSNQEGASLSVEQKRALQLNDMLGPKRFTANKNYSDDDDEPPQDGPKTDVIIDLHTTTANMGTVIIVGQGDVVMQQAAAYVMHKCSNNLDGNDHHDDVLTDFTGGSPDKKKPFNVSILIHTHSTQNDRPHVASIADHALTIEVGPVAQGVLRHDKVEEMQRALKCALEFFKRYQNEQTHQRQQKLADGSAPEKKSSPSLQEELEQFYPSGKVPCYRSAPALKDGELSAKVGWPSVPDNANFPAWIVHKDVQDNDFQQIKTGDPLFVDLDGNVIPYDGSHGSPIRLTFINEGGYYYASSGTGIAVTRSDEFEIHTGELLLTVAKDADDKEDDKSTRPERVKQEEL